MRKANLDRLLRGRPDGIFVNPFEIGSIGLKILGPSSNFFHPPGRGARE
jgi:hypothetical protein